MKWFKHMANARDDGFIEWLEETYGFEGVGRYWRIIEIIAGAMDKNRNEPSAEHTWAKWQILLRGKRSVLLRYLSAIASRGKMNFSEEGNYLKITCPNILKMRDNYTKDLQATGNTLTRAGEEAEADKDKDLSTTPLPPPPVDKIPIPKSQKEEKREIVKYDFDAAAAACCAVLQRRLLTPTDAKLLKGWLDKYDFQNFIKPLLIQKGQRFMDTNHGKAPASLQYFNEAILEKG